MARKIVITPCLLHEIVYVVCCLSKLLFLVVLQNWSPGLRSFGIDFANLFEESCNEAGFGTRI